MYRLILYYLTVLWLLAFILSFFNLLPFTPLAFLVSTFVIFATCYISNKLFSKAFKAITNFESIYITTLILSLIITPSMLPQAILFMVVASIISMGSKYILAFNKKHIFNPAAIGVYIPSMFALGGASWWIDQPLINIAILIGGILLIRKIQRFDLVFSFLFFYCLAVLSFAFLNKLDILSTLQTTLFASSVLFFASVMLTEPSTTPSLRIYRFIYGSIVGLLSFFISLELALIIGNLFSYIVSPKKKLMLKLKEKIKLTKDTYEFVFPKVENFSFDAGQYLEWTLETRKIDRRGNRRYFTIASSPTEENFKIGIKVYEKGSSFKNTLMSFKPGDKVLAGNLSGDFILPKETKNLVFIAGGIGITPFRSMIKYLLDKNLKFPITLFYSNKTEDEIVYKDIFDEARSKLDIKTIYNLTDVDNISKEWKGYRGRINEQIIKSEVPDYKKSAFYLSGPHAMVVGFEETLYKMGVSSSKIKKDFFPGYA